MDKSVSADMIVWILSDEGVMEEQSYHCYRTPFGPITIGCQRDSITRVCLGSVKLEGMDVPTSVTNRCATQLLEYFAGERSVFDLETSIEGSDFQKRVWKAIGLIPYGQTTTPQKLADVIGSPNSYRAVGAAVKDNPLIVLIPAHRVVLSSGYISKGDGSAKVRAAFRELESRFLRATPYDPDRSAG